MLERVLFGVSLVAPALMAAAHTANVADAAHDEAVVRAVGLGWTGIWRAPDAVLASFFMALPLGTRALRAGLASATACGATGGILFILARQLLARCATAPRLGATVAAIASTLATLSVSFQLESGAPGGGVLGACLALVPMAILSRAKNVHGAHFWGVGFAVGIALAYEPLLGLAAAGSAAIMMAWPAGTARRWRREGARLAGLAAIGFGLGMAPLIVALARARQSQGLVLAVPLLAASLGERGVSGVTRPVAFLNAELGSGQLAMAVIGLAVVAFVARARPLAAALVFVAVVGVGAVALGAPSGATRYAPPVLAAIGCLCVLMGVAMQAVVRAIASARIPFARASASMVVLLEVAFPVRAADEALARCEATAREGSATWSEVALGPLPAGAILLLNDPRILPRILALRAEGELRGDIAVVPTFDLGGQLASRELEREPKLGPFWRDLALANAPEEWSLSSLASARPLVTSFDSHWPRPLARHLVPTGLWAVFEPEPRGPSDRKRALDDFARDRARLEKVTLTPPDAELMAATANLLRARVIGFTATGEREVVGRGLDELRPFAPGDRVAGEIVRRVVMAKGVVDVKDLTP